MKRRISSALLSLGLFLTLLSGSIASTSNIADGQGPPGQYIVVLNNDVSDPKGAAEDIARSHGLALGLVYEHALKGFSATIPGPLLDKVKGDPRVNYVEQDQVVQADLHLNNFETLTTGIDRVDAELNAKTNVNSVGIAIIDTGIWLSHVDLNAANGKNCVNTKKNANDDNGHGTHVAGIAAAKTNDGKGVRGVAPNAKVFAVKVLDRNGMGFLSWVICGVDWVTDKADEVNPKIKVANMSLGFKGTSTALNTAITNSVAAGVTYTVSAGNESDDASLYSPASHQDVITVSAMGDSDGKCGATGGNTSYGPDDSFASFSNFGSAVEIAAPGVDITSTYKGDKQNPNGLYATGSGTSQAAPHVAGAAAQYIASNPGATPAGVRSALIAAGTPQSTNCTVGLDGSNNGGFSGDPDGTPEPLLDAQNL